MATGKKNNAETYNPNPLVRAGWISKIFSWWLIDFIRYGNKHELHVEDLYDTILEDQSETLRNILETVWMNEINIARIKNRKPSLWNAIIKTYFWDFLKFSIFPIASTILLVTEPFMLEMMMSYFNSNSTMSQLRAYLNTTVFIAFMLLRSIVARHGFFHFIRLGMRAKIACSSLIYKKMVRLSLTASQSHSSSVINLLTADVSKFETFFTFSPYVFIVPVQLLVTSYFIWQYVKLDVTLAGVGTMMLLTLPILALYSKIFLKHRTKQTSRTDKRILLIGEVVDGIRAVKMYVWEKYFEKCVRLARRLEIISYMKISYITSAIWSLASFCHRTCVFVVILFYVPKYGTITAEQILPVAQHFNNLQKSITVSLFLGITRIAEMRVAMKRIEDFMLLEEVESNVERVTNGISNEIISMENASVSWDHESHVLKSIDLNFVPKKLYAVIGAVGSGKSKILKLILREVRLVSGKVSVFGRVSYASQEPWLFPGSIKDNILFGEIYDANRYAEVVNACQLFDDFTYLPDADNSLVGDRSMNLSGGQCARINLARAVYKDADIYLLDNPLSSVDSHVAKKIMDECINNLLEDKTRILVTNNVELLNEADTIVLLNSEKIEFRGSFKDFKKNHHYLKNSPPGEIQNFKNGLTKLELNSDKLNVFTNFSSNKTETNETEELLAKGSVKLSVYMRYIRAGGFHHVLFIILLNCIFANSVISFDCGLVSWIQDNNSSLINDVENNFTLFSENITQHSFTNLNPLILLGKCILVIVITSILINISFNIFMLSASKNIHNHMFSQLLKTPLRFFETNPSGRILNRFSEDTRIADDFLPKVLFEGIQPAFLVIPLLLSAIIINWWIVIPSGILILLLFLIGRMYMVTMQKLTRQMGNAKSPVLSFVTSSLAGLTTIRACKAKDFVCKKFDSLLDRHTAAFFLISALIPANYLWVELINLGLLASTAYICIALKNDDSFGGYVGLTLMQIMNMTTDLSTMLVRLVQALSSMPNVERMLQFTDFQQEDIKANKLGLDLPRLWPDKGKIKFEKLYLRYSENSDPVLYDLSFTIAAGSKIGIVGRTGAGKSSLISAIFRLASIDGSLLLDGVDIKNIELSTLRSKISIIPQEPFVFKTILRKNLDPLDEFEDALLWSALEDVKLKPLFNTLSFSIDSGGSNLSLGQRQLLCLARAILRQNKILILDEATANIDSVTDTLIQKTIRNKFKKCTVLTIAHRLNTVMDSDKILVMDNGRVVEYDHPFLLLQNNDGYFFNMVEQSGSANQLEAIAEKAHKSLRTQ